GPAGAVADLEPVFPQSLHGLQDLENRIPLAIATIGDERLAATPEIGKRAQMRVHQIADMDIVANAGSIRCRVIRAVDIHARTMAERRLAGDLDQVRGAFGRKPGPPLWIGAC